MRNICIGYQDHQVVFLAFVYCMFGLPTPISFFIIFISLWAGKYEAFKILFVLIENPNILSIIKSDRIVLYCNQLQRVIQLTNRTFKILHLITLFLKDTEFNSNSEIQRVSILNVNLGQISETKLKDYQLNLKYTNSNYTRRCSYSDVVLYDHSRYLRDISDSPMAAAALSCRITIALHCNHCHT